MTKLAFIGAGSLGFTRGLVRDVLTFPLLKDSTISLMDIDPERLDFAYRAVSRIVEMGNYPAKVDGDAEPGRGARRRGRGDGHHPGGQHRRLAARHPDPEGVRGGHQHRRHAQRLRHLPRPAHHPGDARHRPRHGAPLPGRDHAELHQPDGDALPGHAARDQDQADRPVPQRPGHRDDARPLDRARPSRRSPTPAPASTTWPGI